MSLLTLCLFLSSFLAVTASDPSLSRLRSLQSGISSNTSAGSTKPVDTDLYLNALEAVGVCVGVIFFVMLVLYVADTCSDKRKHNEHQNAGMPSFEKNLPRIVFRDVVDSN